MWIPIGAIGTVILAVVLAGVAFVCAGRRQSSLAFVALVAAAICVRAYAAADLALHPWDERYHALVAKNLIDSPLVPTLYRDPVLPYDYTNWAGNHVWLHKPPGALWLQALSMRLFGVGEIPLRVPSLVASAVAVGITFLIGQILSSPAVGVLAAGFQIFNGFLVDLAAGRRASDHVDTLLILFIELGVLAFAVLGRDRPRLAAFGVGAAVGVGCLTKSFSGLVLIPIWMAMRWQMYGARRLVSDAVIATTVAAAIAAPWSIYTASVFPSEWRWEGAYGLRHATETLENQGGPPWKYVWEMPRYFGELVYIPIAWALYRSLVDPANTARRAILAWLLVPYAVFSLVMTKMPGYVMMAAPAIFLIQAEFWWHLRESVRKSTSAPHAFALGLAVVVFALLPARHLLSPTGPLEFRERNPAWTKELRSLNQQIGSARAVVFGTAHPIEAMFYTPYVAYEQLPTEEQVRDLTGRGYRVYVHNDGSPPRLLIPNP
jgi:4-amino-4-deoxy-L-arabinose transferase-like glycosyltransferase